MLDIILSLTRTNRVGYLRDIRRLTVALSRARLGLYILGRREIFEACHELKEAFDHLLGSRPDKLELVTGEMYGRISRLVGDDVEATAMAGVEHLGQYVYEMTQAKTGARVQQGQNPVAADSLDIAMAGTIGSEGYRSEEEEEAQPDILDQID